MTGARHGFSGYLEDFVVGETYRHARGKTVSELENLLITHMVLNTAEPHFNEDAARKDRMFGRRVVFGGVTLAVVIGLAAQDTAAHALRELGMTAIRLHAPVYHGDTLYAYSEVLSVHRSGDRGVVALRHLGFNQDNVHVLSAERRVLVQARPGEARQLEGGR